MPEYRPIPAPGHADNRRRNVVSVVLAAGLVLARAENVAAEKRGFASIAHAYHGLLLDHKFRRIRLSASVIGRFQDSMIESLTDVPDSGDVAPLLDPGFVKVVLSGFDFTNDERLLIKSALIQMGIDSAVPDEQRAYQERFDLINEGAHPFLDPDFRNYRTAFEDYLLQFQLREFCREIWELARPDGGYNALCASAENDVPIPPDLTVPVPADAVSGWRNRGVLPTRFNFLENGDGNTTVLTYEAPNGVCYALPRTNGTRVEALGVICQSRRTGKACFWDNIAARGGKFFLNPGDTMKFALVKNGGNLVENCTNCHRGNNAFNIHPDTPLGALPIELRNPEPGVRYSPIGQASWVNPPPFAPRGSGACAGCHEIPEPTPQYCGILARAARTTMPPLAPDAPAGTEIVPAGWTYDPDPRFAAHILHLKTRCP